MESYKPYVTLSILLLSILFFGCRDIRNIEKENTTSSAIEEAFSETDWKRFLRYWEGDFDNSQQIKEQLTLNIDSVDRNKHLSLRIRRVELPSFGNDVYYAEWFAYENPKKVTRQRIYAFEKRDTALVLKLHIFPMDSAFVSRTSGAYIHASRLKGVTPKDMVPLPGCDVYFRWYKNEYVGAMKKGACAFPAPNSGTPIYSWSQMQLKKDAFEYLDGWFNIDGSVYYEISKDWYTFNRKIETD